jgi:hypothetical protein
MENRADIQNQLLFNLRSRIREGDWEKAHQLFNENPVLFEPVCGECEVKFKEIIQSEPIIEQKIKNEIQDENSTNQIPTEPTLILHPALFLMINIIRQKPLTISKDLKILFIETIIPSLSKNIHNGHMKLITETLFDEIVERFQDEIHENIKLLYLVLKKEDPRFKPEIKKIFYKCKELEHYGLLFNVIKEQPDLIREIQFELPNLVQYLSHSRIPPGEFRAIINEYCPKFLDKLNLKMKEEIKQFLDDFKLITEETEWIHDYHNLWTFNYYFQEFTDDQLELIVSTILLKKIKKNDKLNEGHWINQVLIEISWSSHYELVLLQYKELLELNYTQAIADAGLKNPEFYTKLELEELTKIDYLNRYLDKYYNNLKDKFGIDSLFCEYLKSNYGHQTTINKFYKYYPNDRKILNSVLKKAILETNFTLEKDFSNFIINPHIVLGLVFGDNYYPYVSIDFEIEQKEKWLIQITENDELEYFFSPYTTKFLRDFKEFSENVKERVIEYFTKRHFFPFFINAIKSYFQEIKPFIQTIVKWLKEFKTEGADIFFNEREYLLLLKYLFLHKGDLPKDINTEFPELLEICPDSFEKAEFYMYFMDYNEAQQILNTIKPSTLGYYRCLKYFLLKNACNVILNQKIEIGYLENLIREIKPLLEEIQNSQLEKNKKNRIKFEYEVFQCSILFELSQEQIMVLNFTEAKESLTNASEKSKNLLKLNMPTDLKREVENYSVIIDYFRSTICPIIFNQSNVSNQIILKKIEEIKNNLVKKIEGTSPKTLYLKKKINEFDYNPSNHTLNKIQLGKVANLCPVFPKITEIILMNYDGENIYRWDDNLQSKSIPIIIAQLNQELTLVINFKNLVNPDSYKLDILDLPPFITYQLKELKQFFKKNQIEYKIRFWLNEKWKFSNYAEISIKHSHKLLQCESPSIFQLHISSENVVIEKNINDFYRTLPPIHENLDENLLLKLNNLGFRIRQNTSKHKSWLKIIKECFSMLRHFYDFRESFRYSAKDWSDEKKDMNPFFASELKRRFGDGHVDNSRISDGDADHFVFSIPIEDKLIRTSENIHNRNPIIEKFEKHKKQFMREAKEGFSVIFFADIRDEVIHGKIDAQPLQECFEIFNENSTWFVVFLFQAFQNSPSTC